MFSVALFENLSKPVECAVLKVTKWMSPIISGKESCFIVVRLYSMKIRFLTIFFGNSISFLSSFWSACKLAYIAIIIPFTNLVYTLFSFKLLMDKAIKIPITTRTISPTAYFKYFPVFPSKSKFCLIF